MWLESRARSTTFALALLGTSSACTGLTHVATDAAGEDDASNESDAAVETDAAPCADPDACTPDAPRLLAPHSTGVVTSRRPLFRFAAATHATRYEVQLCRDPACTDLIETVSAEDTEATPAESLPADGAVFWRVIAFNGALSTASVTWELFVGHGDADHATSWLGAPDFDRNGLTDVALGSGSNSAFVVLADPATGLPSTEPSTRIPGTFGFGRATANAGDVDGDGYGDLIVGGLDPAASFAAFMRGGPSGVSITPTILPAPSGMALGGMSVGGAGDVNGDGYADLLVSTAFTSLFLGGPSGPSLTPSGGLLNGGSGAGAGDVNADGFADVIVCSGSAGTATVYYGSASGLEEPQTIVGPSGAAGFGETCITAGDVNGDGYADILVATQGTGSAFVMLGSAEGVVVETSVELDAGGPGSGVGVTTSLASASDVNGDGYDDVIVGAYNFDRVRVHHGSPSGIAETAATTLVLAGEYGASVAGIGDANGDGFDDIAVAPAQCNGYPVLVFAGSVAGVTTAPLRTWDAPPDTQCYGVLAR